LSTTRRAQAKKNNKKGEMEEEKPTEQTKATEADEKKMDEDKKETEEKKEPEEEPTCVLKNPSRVLRLQEKHISYIPENRYEAIL
jgi:26S proteasome regulatory subunit RPN2 C-terminal domain